MSQKQIEPKKAPTTEQVSGGVSPKISKAARKAAEAVAKAEEAAKPKPFRVTDLPRVETARQALERYVAYRKHGRLRMGLYNEVQQGRRVACALGALDIELDEPALCPAKVMPADLAFLVPGLFDSFITVGHGAVDISEDAFQWGEDFYTELARLDGAVPYDTVEECTRLVRAHGSTPGTADLIVQELRKVPSK